MASYITKQRKALLDYLSRHADEALSAKQIAEALAGETISTSAVYRNLAALEQSGSIKRSGKSGSREAYYQYMPAPECREHLHLSCKKCGKTYHMDTDGTALLLRSIAKSERFVVDQADTVLYGVCSNCQSSF